MIVSFFLNIKKSSLFSIAGGSPPCTPRRSAGVRPIGQEIIQKPDDKEETEHLKKKKKKSKDYIFLNSEKINSENLGAFWTSV